MSYRNQPGDVESKPRWGARLPKSNPDTTTDALGNPPKQNQQVFDAVEDKGAARRAVDKQIGETAIPAPKTHGHPQDDSNS